MKIFTFLLTIVILNYCVSIYLGSLPSTKPLDSFASVQNTNAKGEKCTYAESVTYDSKGIPSYNYGIVEGKYIGVQKSPVTIANEALRFYEDEYKRSSSPKNETAKQFFINNADWLVDNITVKQDNNRTINFATYEYTFQWPYYDLKPPWRDAMTQGRALEALVGASILTREEKYIDTAKLILNSFFVEVKDGGVTYKSHDKGWWYEHYADDNRNLKQEPRVLNAMMFTVLGIHEYYNYTHDPLAKFLFNQGILALKNELPRYDKNGDSLYDAAGRAAGSYYLPVHIRLLNELYSLTAEPIFKKYHDLWGTDFILTQYDGRKIEDVYVDTCINSRGLFNIELELSNATNVVDLLDENKNEWRTVNDANVIQNGNELDLIVDTEKEEKTYNRAYLQTELNMPKQEYGDEQENPLLLSLDYIAESVKGNATFVGQMIDTRDKSQDQSRFSFPLLIKEPKELTNEVFVVPKSIMNKPIEFRLYVITDEPGFHSLKVSNAKLLFQVPINLSPII